jgi:hypothetical protein
MNPAEGAPATGFRHALERGDDLVQALTVAKYALWAGDLDKTVAAVDAALEMARHALTELTEAAGNQSVLAASLVRRAPALGPAPSGPTEGAAEDVRLTS